MSVPPPTTPNLSAPPPNLTTINTSGSYQHRYANHREGNRGFFKPFRPYHAPKIVAGGQDTLKDEFDGKRLRKSVMRKTVDYNSAIIKSLENRVWQRDYRDRRALQPDRADVLLLALRVENLHCGMALLSILKLFCRHTTARSGQWYGHTMKAGW